MNRRTKAHVAAVVAILLGGSPLRAAVVTGPDGKPVRNNATAVATCATAMVLIGEDWTVTSEYPSGTGW